MIDWVHEGFNVYSARAARHKISLRPVFGAGFMLVISNTKGVVVVDDVGEFGELQELAESWLEDRRSATK